MTQYQKIKKTTDNITPQHESKPTTVLQKKAIPQLFERLFLISWENNGDCHITMPLFLKTMEVQIKGDQ